MSTSTEDNPQLFQSDKKNKKLSLCTEGILYDVLDKIFSSLSLKDLHRAAAVCKSWQYVATKEMSKRNDIQSLILPIISENTQVGSNDEDDNEFKEAKYLQNSWHISDSLRSFPRLLLCFSDGDSNSTQTSEDFYHHYHQRLKQHCTCLAVFETLWISMDETEIMGKTNLGVGISFPCTSKLKINLFSPDDHDMMHFGSDNLLQKLAIRAANTIINNGQEHNCIIFLSNQTEAFEYIEASYNRLFLFEFMRCLRFKCKPGTFSLWGGEVLDMTTDICDIDRKCLAWSVALGISGTAMKSWSIVLKSNLSTLDAHNNLIVWKNEITLNRNTIALAMVPSNEYENSEQRIEKIKIFRKVFPDISLTTLYNKEEFIQIGLNSLSTDPNQMLEHKNSLVFLIISTK
ncbi:uncharacterized protein LOC106655754 [Trichogramma pretiosum]|uniref:uncharacterized protein LOC106655754 n=1 Tax=Trichogramma pretiosum TaxID=7493 RepID=UPI0006C99F9A|nr:uncharacterized protein LOC106655754 [Trichogramma pretiosum]